MKGFVLYRHVDEIGISDTGIMAEGVVFENGKVVLAWLSNYPSITIFDDLESVVAIHGYDGETIVDFDRRVR